MSLQHAVLLSALRSPRALGPRNLCFMLCTPGFLLGLQLMFMSPLWESGYPLGWAGPTCPTLCSEPHVNRLCALGQAALPLRAYFPHLYNGAINTDFTSV